MRPINTIIFHCSASDSPSADDVSVIRQWHLARGWSDIGYHFFIKKDGTIQTGRPLDQIGAHVQGHNTGTVGVCFSGLNSFTAIQMATIHKIIKQIESTVGHTLRYMSHRDYTNAKTCPNFVLSDFMQGKLTIIKVYPTASALGDPLVEEDVCNEDADI